VKSGRSLILSILFLLPGGMLRAQQPAPSDSGNVIRTETKVVLVDAVVTDKKGAYKRDLTEKDFKVWEDNKEQKITSFSFEADPASPNNSQKRYLVLFFDNSTMDFGEQARARQAATKFIESNAGPNRVMAVVNFSGGLQISQNFTEDVERLKAATSGIKIASVSPNEVTTLAGTQLSTAAADFGARDMILSLRSLAKNLSSVPGRKILVLLTSGFPVTPEQMSEVTATIDICNRSNVAIYPIDVRGLAPPAPPQGALYRPDIYGASGQGINAFLQPAAYRPGSVAFFMGQRAPGGGAPGGGGGRTGGGSTSAPPGGGGTRTSGGGTGVGSGRGTTTAPTNTGNTGARGGGGSPMINPMNNPNNPLNPLNQPRNLIPKFPDSLSTNQQLMYMLANGTGGFVIANTNDLLAGMEKIAKEQNEFYLLGYTPPESEEGSCHTLKVKVEGAVVRARTGYCYARPRDLLAGNTTEKGLEAIAASAKAGTVNASMQLPYFYTSPNVARVNVAVELNGEAFKFDKHKGKFHSEMNVLGIASRADGSVAARFSDTVKLDFDDKKQMQAFAEKPFHYENQFDIGSGQYNLKVVFSSGGEGFGKMEAPLVIDAYDSKQFALSGIALSKTLYRASDMGTNLDAALIEDRTPLIAQGMQIIPYGSNRFEKDVPTVAYFEVYEPLLVNLDPKKVLAVAVQLRVLDRKTKQEKSDSGMMRIPLPEKGGNPVVPVGMQIPKETLSPGQYTLELQAVDSANKSTKRLIDFDIL